MISAGGRGCVQLRQLPGGSMAGGQSPAPRWRGVPRHLVSGRSGIPRLQWKDLRWANGAKLGTILSAMQRCHDCMFTLRLRLLKFMLCSFHPLRCSVWVSIFSWAVQLRILLHPAPIVPKPADVGKAKATAGASSLQSSASTQPASAARPPSDATAFRSQL